MPCFNVKYLKPLPDCPFAKSTLLTLITLSASLTFAQGAAAQQSEETEEPIEAIYVWGRGTELLGEADSGSHGLVGNADFSTRPMMRVGELVEVIPGMIATQHSGPGKANQYFLRGMNLDHGSDFTAIFEGMPINFRSHAHASGYLDINIIIPEIIETVEFHKGTYYAQNGDFSAAGSARFKTYDRIEQNYVELTLGNFNHQRVLGAASVDTTNGTMLFAGEAEYRDGPWDLEQDVNKYNGFLKYTGDFMGIDSQLTFMAYDSNWNATDQIPLREVLNGNLSRFGFVDGTLGGESSRYSMIGNFDFDNNFTANAYYSNYSLNLFGNPTYFLNDPVNGDQIEQEDQRSVWGGFIKHSQELVWKQRPVTPTLGVEFRFDDIDEVNLFNTRERQRLNAVRNDTVEELSFSMFGEVEVLWSDRFRTTFGLRGEFFNWDVDAQLAPNSGSGSDSLIMPKFSAAWIPVSGYEVYFNYGEGFHSNDVRGAEISIDPVTGDPVSPVDTMVQAEGAEIGVRAEPTDGVNITLVGFWMELDSELLFVGDAGTSEPNDATERRGVELSAFWELNDWIVLDATATYNRARFQDAPSGADYIPDAHKTTASAGITLVHPSGFTGSFRMRHFGDAPLEETDTVQKDGTTLFNLGLSYTADKYEVGLDVLNVFDDDGNDIEFFFESQLAGEIAPVADFHFHPVESRAYRARFRYKF
ncbi:TonB-dependent receptor plug domain-containing protein [Gammaproteobacteria bacterium]|nr:TonB-dependent receptor plug domain-containing protein [Gammaproteobacteria bacterium]